MCKLGPCLHSCSSLDSWSKMDFTTPLVFLCFVLLFKLIIGRYRPPTHGQQLPPGPWKLPLVGSLHHLLLSRSGDLPHRAMRDLSRAHGPLMLLRLSAVPTLVVSSAEPAREVMRTHDAAFASRHLSAALDIITCGGKGILFSPYDDRWRELRRVCVHELFSQRRVLSFRPAREDEVARLLRAVSDGCRDGQAVNLSEKVFRMTNDTVVRADIGGRCHHRDEFLHELDEAVRLTGGINLADLYPSSRLVRRLSVAARDMVRCQRNIYRIVQSIIRERAGGPEPERDDDLLGVLLRLQKDGGLQFELTTEEDVVKVRSSVRLSYLHLVIKEVLSLHPPAPLLLPRECRETCRVMGYDVPKGTKVFVNVWAMGRDDMYWGDAEAFRPERFENSTVDFKGADFEFIPFGAGRRMCPGMSLGMANMELALAGLLFHFDWELPCGVRAEDMDMAETFGITVRRKTKLLLHAKSHVPCGN